MLQKPLHFVQRGRILLRCGSALALSLPSLGVSSLDLGRLFTQAALFLETVIYFLVVVPGCAKRRPGISSFRVRSFHSRPGMTIVDPIPPPPGTARDRRAERRPALRPG